MATLDADTLKGYGAYQWTMLDFDKYWAVTKKDTPILKSFATEIPSISGVKKLYDISWYNADKKSYMIDSMEDLHGFFLLAYNTNFEGKTIKLGADIVVNTGSAAEWAKKVPKYKWSPVGTNSNPFKGIFDGQMHSISGIYLKTNIPYSGLFGATADNATIKNLKLVNSYLETTALSFGGIAGRGRGTFDTIYSNAIVVSSTGNVGGIIGQVPAESKIKINNCWFDGSVTATGNTSNDRRFGGIVGTAFSNGTISNCLNTGIIDVSKYTAGNINNTSIVAPVAGGVIGNIPRNVEIQIFGCLNVGKVLVSEIATAAYGPIVGYRDGVAKIIDAYAVVDSCKSFNQSHINGLVTPMDFSMLRGYGAYQWTFLDFEKYWAVVMDSTPILQSFAGVVPSLVGIDKMIDYSWMEQAKGTAEDPYILMDTADLYGFAKLSKDNDFTGKTITLREDIVVNKDMNNPAYVWTPIGTSSKPFAGTFDGYNPETKEIHSISGIYLKTNERFAGLFANTSSSAVIKNFSLEDSYIETTAGDCGSIVGRGSGTLDTVKSSATVISSNGRVGGLVGQLMDENAVLNNCWFAGTVTSTANDVNKRSIGGLIGYIGTKNVTVTHSLNTGTVDVTAYTEKNSATSKFVAPLAGGLIGRIYTGSHVKISGCLNTGEVKCSDVALAGNAGYGSVIGYCNGTADISNTYATTESCELLLGGNQGVSGKANQLTAGSIKGYLGYQWTTLDFEHYWSVVLDNESTVDTDESGTPILKSFTDKVPSLADVDRMIDFSWMEQAKGTAEDPYILSDAADLFGLKTLSVENNFAEKHIKLAADIVINQGDAKEWKNHTPSYVWSPIGSLDLPFAGIFDGDGHSISGIYLNTTSRWSGLFGATADSAKIQNLKLKNSYMKTAVADFGSIAGVANGEFHTIYSDAIIDCAAGRSGGMFGQANGANVKMTKCWFDGMLINSTTIESAIGGIVGVVVDGTKLTMTSCYNTGQVDVSACIENAPYTGGIVGRVGIDNKSGELVLDDSLNVGMIKVSAERKFTAGYGAVVGMVSKNAKSTITNTYYTEKSCDRMITALGTYIGLPKKISASILGNNAETNMPSLSWGTTWECMNGTIPALEIFKDEILDTRWLNKATGAETDPYLLMDSADLYGLAMLSKETNFAGKYFKLGANIVVNQGDAKEWKNHTPSYVWSPIGSQDLPFAGIFDGDGHSISGIYLNTTSRWSGLFGTTANSAKIQNLKLKNSYMKTTAADFGSIAGVANGEFHTIYSDTIVDCAADRSGGMFGQAYGVDIKMTKCWFDGALTNSGQSSQAVGGIVGAVVDGTKLTMTSCYNSGQVDVTACVNKQPYAGGIVGRVGMGGSGELVLDDSLNVGTIEVSTKHTSGFGAVAGMVSNKAKATIANTYCTPESCGRMISVILKDETNNVQGAEYSGGPKYISGSILGHEAMISMPNLSWDKSWSTTEELPILTMFINEKTSFAQETTAATADDETQLTNAYTGRTLYQGEMHNHALTYGLGLGDALGDDGTINLATWKTQMVTYGLDFAASLDHNQSNHIEHSDWDKSKFVYGSELAANITDDQGTTIGTLHFDLIFKTKQQFDDFRSSHSENFTTSTQNETEFFLGGTFTKSEFKTFIQGVIQAGGFFNLPHPFQNEEYPINELENYYFGVLNDNSTQSIYGLQVITNQYNSSNTNTNYSKWVEMLSKDYRVYAMAGSDNHADLHANSLTSIYAQTCSGEKCDGNCMNDNCTGYDKGNMITIMQKGDFVAGSAGVKMCIGNTTMGGTTDFSNNRVVVDVEKIHTTFSNNEHTYCLDVINDQGVVYSKTFTLNEKGEAEGIELAFRADEASQFYRVVVYDLTAKTRIAIGNPIWNN